MLEATEPTAAEPAATEEEELLLDSGRIVDAEADAPLDLTIEAPEAVEEPASAPATQDKPAMPSWLQAEGEAAPEPRAPRVSTGGGTLFERMSNIARGQAKADDEGDAKSDPLDIPRFLNRQNNQ
jgi:cell division protein FtsZ